MRGKVISYVLIVGLILVSLVVSSVLSGQKKPLKRVSTAAAAGRPPATSIVALQDVDNDLRITGRLVAVDRLNLYSEVAGSCSEGQHPFRAGSRFAQGDTLLQIDASIYHLNLLAQKSSFLNQLTNMLPDLKLDFPGEATRWEKYIAEFSLETPLAPLPEAGPLALRYFLGARSIYNLYYNTCSMEETLTRYTLMAPFDGVLTEVSVSPGTWVRSTQQVGVFIGTGNFELQSAVAVSRLDQLQIGQPVSLSSAAVAGEIRGRITRLNNAVDTRTETVELFIDITDDRLLDGLYLAGTIRTNSYKGVAVVPVTAIVNHNQVYCIDAGILRLTAVEIIGTTGDSVLVRGLNEGELILTEVVTAAREGASLTELRQS